MPRKGAASVALEHWKNRVRRLSVASQSGGRLARSRADGPHPIIIAEVQARVTVTTLSTHVQRPSFPNSNGSAVDENRAWRRGKIC